MKFDTIIIGGGLTALTAGISLAKKQKRVAVIGSGQSTLHFNSGSLDLLGYDANGKETANPLEAIKTLPAEHPYHKVGDIKTLANEAKLLLEEAAIGTSGEATANHYRISPVGELVPAWLTIDNMVVLGEKKLPWKNVILANIEGFLDFQVNFLKPALEKLGANVVLKTFTTHKLEFARQSPSEFRATNIAKYLDEEVNVREVAAKLNDMGPADVILLPAVLGIANENAVATLRKNVNVPIAFLATMHPSVPGTRIATLLRRRFQALGGFHFLSDTVTGGKIKDGRVLSVTTHNMVEERMEADNFVLATGSFMSRGLRSNYQEVWEPIFRLDVSSAKERRDWHNDQFFNEQAFMSFGVKTDGKLHALKDGKPVANLYAAGSVLGGNDFIKFCDHEGVDMITALQVAHYICL